jgi:lipopolysaccharide export system permease protein
MLSQLLALFGFFSLVLVLVYWINRAVGLFDKLIGDGQSALVFLEFSLLTLPFIIQLVLPISAFAATVYVTNRLTSESELVVMQATGFSAFRLARPVLYFGLIVALMMMALMHVLVPISRTMMADRNAEISENVTARFLTEGQFTHPAKGITLYIREITESGELLDIFLTDERAEKTRTTYTARRAFLVKGTDGPKLVMFDGMAQSIARVGARMSVTRFADFAYDLAGLIKGKVREGRGVDELSTWELLVPAEAALVETGRTRAVFLFEGHNRFAQPFLATAAAMIGFAALLLGAFSRFGLWRQILFAVLLLIVVQTVNTVVTAAGRQDARGWILAYVPPLFGVGIAVALLWLAQRPRRVRRGGEVLA